MRWRACPKRGLRAPNRASSWFFGAPEARICWHGTCNCKSHEEKDGKREKNGNHKGRLSVVDGEPLTSWADYRDFELEIDDPNDIDMDGLPDIVSLPEPAAAAQALASLLTVLCLNRRRRSKSHGPCGAAAGQPLHSATCRAPSPAG